MISISYLLLRVCTAAGAVAAGFVQTFVFARVLTPQQFSIFIVVGTIGYTLWLADLGLTSIVFVNLRSSHLGGRRDEQAARQATAIVLFHAALAGAASLACFVIMPSLFSSAPPEAFELALFLLYITLNLAWTSLRSISIATDQFLFYEKLEVVRRVVNIATLLAMLSGLPLIVFLIVSNMLWAILFAAASARLVARGALAARLRGFVPELTAFFRLNRHSIARSATSALSGVFVATFPYYVVPVWFGLGAAPIILEVTFKIFRGACVIFAALCDIAVPGQTRALAARDAGRLIRTTAVAAGLCLIPAALAGTLLVVAGGPLFTFLLRSAATVPHAIVPILVVLLLASVVQIVAETLLQYTGFFRSLAYNGATVAAAMILVTAVAIIAGFDLTGFLAAYTIVYAAGAALLALAVIFGPVRAAARPGKTGAPDGRLTALRNAQPMQPAIPGRQDTARRTPLPSQNP